MPLISKQHYVVSHYAWLLLRANDVAVECHVCSPVVDEQLNPVYQDRPRDALLQRDAAHNLSLLLSEAGDTVMAQRILHQYILF